MNCHRFSRHTSPTLSDVTSKGDRTYKCDHPHAIRLGTHDPGRGVIYIQFHPLEWTTISSKKPGFQPTIFPTLL